MILLICKKKKTRNQIPKYKPFALQKFALGVGFGHQILSQTGLNDV
jgi:hypothetical protein